MPLVSTILLLKKPTVQSQLTPTVHYKKQEKNCLRWPSFSGLNGKQGQHGGGHIVVVKLLAFPHPGENTRREAVVGLRVDKVLAPENKLNY